MPKTVQEAFRTNIFSDALSGEIQPNSSNPCHRHQLRFSAQISNPVRCVSHWSCPWPPLHARSCPWPPLHAPSTPAASTSPHSRGLPKNRTSHAGGFFEGALLFYGPVPLDADRPLFLGCGDHVLPRRHGGGCGTAARLAPIQPRPPSEGTPANLLLSAGDWECPDCKLMARINPRAPPNLSPPSARTRHLPCHPARPASARAVEALTCTVTGFEPLRQRYTDHSLRPQMATGEPPARALLATGLARKTRRYLRQGRGTGGSDGRRGGRVTQTCHVAEPAGPVGRQGLRNSTRWCRAVRADRRPARLLLRQIPRGIEITLVTAVSCVEP
jgi:hypothetical protein